MYQVGFGDCFLVSFEYAAPLGDGRSERHMLIDFGRTRRPPQGGDLEDVARLIREHTGGKLDVIVVSHRHKDHLSGFAVDAAAEIIGELEPGLIVRAWTEDPTLASDAQGPAELGERSRRFVQALRGGQALAGSLTRSIPASESRGLLGDLRGLAAAELANREAVERLDAWADGAGAYLLYGAPSGIEALIPGIRVRVLGPPTLEQWPEIARQRDEDPEFWMLYRNLVKAPAFSDLLAAASVDREAGSSGALGPEQWLIQRMRRQEVGSLLRIVRALDDVLNNTSLILLIDAGDARMLFPGDAQIENWNYALKNAPDRDDVLQDLALVDLYKVGHHGSRNATPRTLFGLWTEDAGDRPMTGLMSTLTGVHGESEATAVPRATLAAALTERMSLTSTEALPAGQPFAVVEADLTNGGVFRLASIEGGSG